MEFETSRLLLRKFHPSDALSLFELNRDPKVIQFTHDTPFENTDAARNFLLAYDHYEKFGFGRWAVVWKETNEFIGFCGLKSVPERDEIDLGYRLHRRFWNRGIATEAGKASIDHGFRNFGIKCIIARALKENTASIRVMEKCGMKFWKEGDFEGAPGIFYKIEK